MIFYFLRSTSDALTLIKKMCCCYCLHSVFALIPSRYISSKMSNMCQHATTPTAVAELRPPRGGVSRNLDPAFLGGPAAHGNFIGGRPLRFVRIAHAPANLPDSGGANKAPQLSLQIFLPENSAWPNTAACKYRRPARKSS